MYAAEGLQRHTQCYLQSPRRTRKRTLPPRVQRTTRRARKVQFWFLTSCVTLDSLLSLSECRLPPS